MDKLTVEMVIEKRIIVRDKRSELKKKFDEADTKLKDIGEQCEVWLMKRANELGVDSFKVKGVGTAYTSVSMRVSCSDWPLLHSWVKETGNLGALEQRVSKKFVQEFREEFHDLPPGVNVFEENIMNVRRSNSTKEEV